MAGIAKSLVLFAAVSLATAQEKLTVHVVPHTHDDVGWLKTVDEYYAGKNNTIQNAYVHMILDTVIKALKENPERTFTYVEQAFFQRWWRQQTEEVRELTRQLVKSGQLEMTNGGWCMHDEAAPHYLDMIDQTTLGHKFLMEEFGVCPTTGWQLDPFGHSATQAALLSAEVGFNALYFGRIDYQDLDLRRKEKSAEFIWRASPSLGPDAQVFASLTGEYGGNYGPPAGFDWGGGPRDEPVQDDPNLEDYNVKSRVNDFVNDALTQAAETRGSHILFTMGSDFEYENAFNWFVNLDKIIKYVNADGRVKAMYSTPARYTAAKASETKVQWPLKENDFFPYADGPHQFWTGYFTSRPALKRYVRETGAILRLRQQVVALAGGVAPGSDDEIGMQKLWEAQGVAQHHDAVSGTAKQHVTFDYAKRLSIGRVNSEPALLNSFEKFSGSRPSVVCDLRNVSVCAPTQEVGQGSQGVCFSLWNALAQSRRELVELPVSSANVAVTDSLGQSVASQVVPALPSITNYGQPAGGAEQTLVFEAVVRPMGYNSYCLKPTAAATTSASRKQHDGSGPVVLENDHVSLKFCDNNLCEIKNKDAGITLPAKQSWLWYESSEGNADSSQSSGAYIFRPVRNEASPVFNGTPTLTVVSGSEVQEVHQTFGPWVSQRIRLGKDWSHAEITYTVGEIPVSDRKGKEIISRITTDLQTEGKCFTDSNGREMLQRKRDFRHYWNLTQTEEVAGNYFPITTALFIKDDNAQLTILTDASQAGTGCVKDGEIELMVHRRVLKDDNRGVTEPLDETESCTPYVGPGPHGQHYGPGLVIRGTHLLSLSKPAEAAQAWRPLMDNVHMPLYPMFGVGKPVSGFFLNEQPPNVQVISLHQWSETQVLLRIAHQFGIGEDAQLSKPVEVNLMNLFVNKTVKAIEERGLAATITRADVNTRRTAWPVEGESPLPARTSKPAGSVVTLGPLQIRTFFVQLESPVEQPITTFV